eukprot:TRINITY_DN29607_c0_g1_i4.p1 TRINITY_DN29607_c0_g1~~TRINITY_DN29607_c0_g1_i4.p1  ORF type:complete len:181 (+),score=17.31 TRINITY_DN29607_c0_g1_i4:448-990(+)
MEAYQVQQKVWCLDSFAGLPVGVHPRDPFWSTSKYLEVPLDAVRDNFQRYALLDDNVKFVPGWFEDTVPELKKKLGRLAVMRVDSDLYKSALDILCGLYEHLVVGGYWIFDDWGFWNVRYAVFNFIKAHNLTDRPTRGTLFHEAYPYVWLEKKAHIKVNQAWCLQETSKRGGGFTSWRSH